MICAGIDAGSRTIKVVLADSGSGEIIASALADQGLGTAQRAERLLEELLAAHKLRRADIARTVATGYARNIIPFADARITEITCHAKGVHRLNPQARTVVEIGGQDSKLLRLNHAGGVQHFDMNDRCAAGTGCFLEVVARRLGLTLEQLGELALQSHAPSPISSMCVVFAETEIIGLLAGEGKPEDIAAGVQHSVAARLAAMAGRQVVGPIIFTGGVALVPGMREALAATLAQPVAISPHCQFTGAYGAALLAAEPA